MNNPLCMGCAREALQAKLRAPASPLAPWVQHVLTLARRDPVWYSPYTVLAALVTDDAADRERARRSFLRLVELRAEGYASLDAQFHTHVIAAPLGRWALYYDWIADLGWLTPAEDQAFREALLDYAYVFPLQHLQSRMKSFDNQMLANAFGAAACGAAGLRREPANALARKLATTGLKWLTDLLGRIPPGGYSQEGSIYHEQVVTPLVALAGRLVAEVTGTDAFAHGLPPDHVPLNDVLRMTWRLIGPTGLVPGWDAGGSHASLKSGLVCLARETGDPAPLAAIAAAHLWYRSSLVAWDIDDRLWTLVWWPADQAPSASTAGSWLVPAVAGALVDHATQTRLFQYWDPCGGLANSGRSQVNPNAILLETGGSPLLLDGSGELEDHLLPLDPAIILAYAGDRVVESIREYVHSAWGGTVTREQAARMVVAGCVGYSNSLIFDGEDWYVPQRPVGGHGDVRHEAGPLQLLRSDATACYADRYDVSRVTRSSLLVGGRYVLTGDRVVAATPHRVTWQVFARPECRIAHGRAVIQTPEQRCAEVIPLQEGSLFLDAASHYPKWPLGGSVRLRHALAAASDVRLDLALVLQSASELVATISDGWERVLGEHRDVVDLDQAYLSDPGSTPDQPRVFRRHFLLSSAPAGKVWLVVRVANQGTTLTVNGTPVPPRQDQNAGDTNWRYASLPWHFEISRHLRAGDNEFCLSAPYFHGETLCGPVTLCRERPLAPVAARRTGPAAFRVSIGEATDEVLFENEAGLVAWAGGETDARSALLAADGTVAAVQVMHLRLPNGLHVRAEAPCDLAWTPAETVLSRMVSGTLVELTWHGASLLISDQGHDLSATWHGRVAHRLRGPALASRLLTLNGKAVAAAAEGLALPVSAPGAARAADVPTSAQEVYALAERLGPAAAPHFLAALRSTDWRVQVAAADTVGRLHLTDAVPVLLELFAAAEDELPYPPLKKWWRWSKMLRNPGAEEGLDPDLPLPLGVKRWRVKRAVVTALGRLGDARAVAPFEAALTRADDFFPVTSQLAVALGRLGAPSSIAVLTRHQNHSEANTRIQARLALALLQGSLDRATFEDRVGAS